MLQIPTLGITLLAFSIIPLVFLSYTVTHLDELGIGIRHPRVIVGLLIFVGLLVAGVILLIGPPII